MNLNCNELRAAKKALRSEIRMLGAKMDCRELFCAGETICRKLESLPELVAATDIAGYLSDATEADLRPLLHQLITLGKNVYLPRFQAENDEYVMVRVSNLDRDLTIGNYHLLEPKAELPATEKFFCDEKMTYLVPGVAFDDAGHRLGRGKGYYDRMLANAGQTVIGIFFDFCRVPRIPTEAHDHGVDLVVTEKNVFRFQDKNRSN